jgi:hypothetical protein
MVDVAGAAIGDLDTGEINAPIDFAGYPLPKSMSGWITG